MASNGTTIAWAAEVGVIAWRDWRNSKRLPYPSEVLATFLIFGLLSLLPDSTDPLGPLLGAGIVIATVLKAFDPTKIGVPAFASGGPSLAANTAGPSVPVASSVQLAPVGG